MKVYLCGITDRSNYQNIKELTDPIWEHVDGLIFGYDGAMPSEAAEDECYDLLWERAGEGDVILRPWTNDHDLQMNTFLREGPLQNGDWIIIRDSMERFDPDFAKNLKDLISKWDAQGIRSIFNYGKGFAFKWNDGMVFQGSPHWGLVGAQGKAIDLKDNYDEDKKEHTWRLRDGEEGGRSIDNKINHEAKYAWNYGRSNHLLLGNEHQIQAYERAELIRRHVRDLAQTNGFELNLEGLKEFMKWMKETDATAFEVWINSHRVWKNFYRFYFLEERFEDIENSENEWKFKSLV